jgi:hypothetical protein
VTVLEAVITCPICGRRTLETMPENACQYFCPCPGCDEMLRPREGDCCVFCSFGTVPCPPKQSEGQTVPHGGADRC